MDYFNQETERFILRKLTKEDIQPWSAFFVDNPDTRFVGVEVTKGILEHSQDWIDKQLARYENNDFGLLAAIDKSNGKIVGQAGIMTRDLDGKKEFEIGYSILPEYWGNGIATELAQQLKRFGQENSLAEKFISIIHKENHGSMNVARKNGMTNLRETVFHEMEVFVFGD